MRLTVLGSCGAYPEPGRACSGFAVEEAGYRVVLDLGYGTLPRLLEQWPDGPHAVVITHEHPDHCADLHGLFRMQHYGGLFQRLTVTIGFTWLTLLVLRRGNAGQQP